jgi:hypothetical protein
MEMVLDLFSGLAWTIVYFDCIRVGIRDRTYAMPVAALALNIAWESMYAVHGLAAGISMQAVINVVWVSADVAVVVTFFRFGRREFPSFITPMMFGLGAGGLLVVAYVLQGLFVVKFGWNDGGVYAAFLQNVLMSALFISMLLARRGDRGQTLLIATAKWLGTLAPTLEFAVLYGRWFILGLGLLCTVFDLAYLGLLQWVRTHPETLRSPTTSAIPGR